MWLGWLQQKHHQSPLVENGRLANRWDLVRVRMDVSIALLRFNKGQVEFRLGYTRGSLGKADVFTHYACKSSGQSQR
jgi:hypothetical protein